MKGNVWFGSDRCTITMAQQGKAFFGQVKPNQSLFPKDYIEEALKDAPGGSHIVLKCTHQEVELIALGYQYSSKRTLHFIFISNGGSTTPGTPYEMKFTENFGNIQVRDVDRPAIISKFVQESNCVDKYNQARQSELVLEKKWLTDNAHFRLFTTMIGISATDTWKLAAFHWLLSYIQEKNNTILSFAGILAKQLLTLATQIERREDITFNMTNDESVSDISGISSVTASPKRPQQGNFQE